MAQKLEDQEIMDKTINSVLMGTTDANQQRIAEIIDDVISKVAEDAKDKQSQAEHRTHCKEKEVLPSSHRAQVLFNFCNLVEYEISHTFQIYEIYVKI